MNKKKILAPKPNEYDSISFFFRDYRKYLVSRYGSEWSQANVARTLKMPSCQYLSNIERGTCLPSVEISVKLANLYSIDKKVIYKLWMKYREKMYKKIIFEEGENVSS